MLNSMASSGQQIRDFLFDAGPRDSAFEQNEWRRQGRTSPAPSRIVLFPESGIDAVWCSSSGCARKELNKSGYRNMAVCVDTNREVLR